MQRYISADYIFPVSGPPLKEGLIAIDSKGYIQEVFSSEQADLKGISRSETERHQGVICPGFVNAHCHLELSYLKGAIPVKTGMAGFIKTILSLRGNFSAEQISKAIEKAEKEMITGGIVAVGDISNTDSSFV